MPHPKKWIEAQLKRGYTKKQIKSILIKKGYPLNAVAEVDRIARPSKKVSSPNIKIILVIGIIIVVAIALYFSGFKFGAEKDFLSLEEAIDKSGYTEGYLEQLAKDGKIGSKIEDDRIFISTNDLEKYMEEIEQAPEVLQPQPPEDLQPPEIVPLDESEVPGVLPVKGFLTSEPALYATKIEPIGSIESPCEPFTSETDEITCEQSTQTALEKYPGEIYYLTKNQYAWIVGVKFDNTTVNVEVDLKTGEIK